MARIRTIKPEFQQSASMGKVSRDARLTFILMWPQSDDSGRLRGNSRMLASVLYPYDDDAPGRINGWLDELESAGSIQRYRVDDAEYIQICKWLEHQRIDHPTESKLPTPRESSRKIAKKKERSRKIALDQGLDQGREGTKEGNGIPVEQSSTERVFDHWKSVHQHPKATLDAKRKRVIEAALRSYSEADLCQSISGYRNSPHHMGENDRRTVYDAIETMLRDAQHIDAGLRFYESPPNNLSQLTRRNVAATEDWQPPEVRHAAK